MSTNAKQYQCTQCSRSYDSQPALDQHVRDSHHPNMATAPALSAPPQSAMVLPCDECLRKFSNQAALDQHKRNGHLKPKGVKAQSPPGSVPPPVVQSVACDECSRRFDSAAALAQHKEQSHVKQVVTTAIGGKLFPCPHCKRAYDSQASLDQHIEASHQPNSGQSQPVCSPPTAEYPCNLCNKKFTSFAALEQHKAQSHKSQSPPACAPPTVEFPCDQCNRKFTSPTALEQHKAQAHIKQVASPPVCSPPTGDFPCKECNRKFTSSAALEQHKAQSHIKQASGGQSLPVSSPPSGDFPCNQCNKKFTSPTALEQHKAQAHKAPEPMVMPASGKPFPCPHCKRTYDSQASLDQHIEASHQPNVGQSQQVCSPPTGDFPCNLCNKKFTSATALEQHKAQSHKEPEPKVVTAAAGSKTFPCPHCKRTYDSQASLDQHIEASHQPNSPPVSSPPTGDFPCNQCNKKFSSATAVEQHKAQAHAETGQNGRRPSGESFTCWHCAAEFDSLVQLQQHQSSSGHNKAVSNPRKASIENIIKGTKMAITKEDQKKSRERVKNVIDTLIVNVRSQDGGMIYIPDVRKAGSTAVGVKIGMADEFDTNIPIKVDIVDVTTQGTISYIYNDKVTHSMEGPSAKNLNVPRKLIEGSSYERNIPNGQAVVKVDPNTTPAYLTYKGYLIPHMVLEDFYKKLQVALRDTSLADQGVHLSKEAHGPALTLTLKQPGRHDISVDLTISLATDLPVDKHGWPRDKTYIAFGQEKIEEVTRAGTHLVPKGDETWSISFSKSEKVLLGKIDAGNGCRKAVLKFLKRHFQICQSRSQDGLPGISSHIVKTQLLWSSEAHPGTDHWHMDNLDRRVIETMSELEKSLTDGKLPYYFCPLTDVLGNKDRGVLNRLAAYLKEERLKLEKLPTKSPL